MAESITSCARKLGRRGGLATAKKRKSTKTKTKSKYKAKTKIKSKTKKTYGVGVYKSGPKKGRLKKGYKWKNGRAVKA